MSDKPSAVVACSNSILIIHQKCMITVQIIQTQQYIPPKTAYM